MFCEKCGSQINDGAKFCSVCGNMIQAPGAARQANTQPQGAPQMRQGGPAPSDSYQMQPTSFQMTNKSAGFIGYLSWVGFIMSYTSGRKDHPYVKFHLNQALVSNLMITAFTVLLIISSYFRARYVGFSYFYGGGGAAAGWTVVFVISLILFLLSLVLWLVAFIGALQERMQEAPIIGRIRVLK